MNSGSYKTITYAFNCRTRETGIDRFKQSARNDIEQIKDSQKEFSDRLFGIEQKGSAGNFNDRLSSSAPNFGSSVSKAFAENSDLFFKSRSMSLAVKAVLQSQVGSVASEGPAPKPSGVKTSLVSAIPSRSLQGVASLTYSRIADVGQLAGVQAGEGVAKTQAQPLFASITQNAITVAGWCELSEQSLKTQGELSRVIDIHLKNSIMLALDIVLIDGTAVASWPFSGLESLAPHYDSVTYTLLHDAVVEAAAHMRLSGYEPDVVCINPMTFLGIALAKDTTGQYLSGSYMNDIPASLHGMRVTFSGNIAAGKALVVDSRYSELLISDEINVQFGYKDDGFVRNVVIARGEVSVIPVVRDLSAMYLVTPKP